VKSAVYAVKLYFFVTYATAKEACVFVPTKSPQFLRVNLLNPLKVGPFQSNDKHFFIYETI